jgi:hypothetical protein
MLIALARRSYAWRPPLLSPTILGEDLECMPVLWSGRTLQSRADISVSVEYAGESVRDLAVADSETEVFLLIEAIRTAGLPSTGISQLGAAAHRDLSSLINRHTRCRADPAQGRQTVMTWCFVSERRFHPSQSWSLHMEAILNGCPT